MTQIQPLVWSDDYKIGIDIIDNEHKSLVSSFNRFVDQINQYEEAATIKYGLDILESYISYHFKHEEDIMAKVGYPGLEVHVAFHNALIDDLMDLKAALFKRKLTGAQFCDLFRKWLPEHVMDQDTRIAEFVRHRPDAAPSAWWAAVSATAAFPAAARCRATSGRDRLPGLRGRGLTPGGRRAILAP